MAATAGEVKKHIRIYLFIFGALAVLTVVTVAASWLELGVAAGIAVALLIASLKGSLVASVFMHLTNERAWLHWILIMCAIFFVALILIPVLQTSETAGLQNRAP